MNKKILYRIIPVVFVFFMVITNIYGFGNGFDESYIEVGEKVNTFEDPVRNIWGTVSLILQICAVGGIIFTGIRYMFATSDVKSDMKKTLPFLIIGVIIVFGAVPVINFIVNVFTEATKAP